MPTASCNDARQVLKILINVRNIFGRQQAMTTNSADEYKFSKKDHWKLWAAERVLKDCENYFNGGLPNRHKI